MSIKLHEGDAPWYSCVGLMQNLIAISTLCSLAAGWAIIVVVRRIRASREQDDVSTPARLDFAYHLVNAANADLPEPRSVAPQSISDIAARKSWIQPAELVAVRPRPEHRSATNRHVAESLEGRRKLPQPAHHVSASVDRVYFSKDSGDMTDLHTSPRIRANSSKAHKRS